MLSEVLRGITPTKGKSLEFRRFYAVPQLAGVAFRVFYTGHHIE